MELQRASGILLHPTSLPGRFGIGDLGQGAEDFIEFLTATGQHLWQVLPLGPTGYGDSPYQSLSAFAGNRLLISLEQLVRDGYLEPSDLEDAPSFPAGRVDYSRVISFKTRLLRRAFDRFQSTATPHARREFETFCSEQRHWLDDYALFKSIKDAHQGKAWIDWEPDIAARKPAALEKWAARLRDEVQAHKFFQFTFFKQWEALKQQCHANGIRIIGDVPIFVAHDSADVWAHPELFHLDGRGHPTKVAGVPPDYFSATGQLWGNPLYRWDVLAETGYDWWIERLRATFRLVDIIRLDHFRGFEAYWEVPAEETTAINGRWVKGPGAHFFEVAQRELGPLPIIAEDLGVITPEVLELRDRFGFPGMKVLQFAFGDDPSASDFRPHNYIRNCVVYTGTHDNDTTVGWFTREGSGDTTQTPDEVEREREMALKYLGTDGHEIHWDFIRLAFSSVANTAIVPLQDVLGLGNEARMNLPGRPEGNWQWRFSQEMLTPAIRQRLTEMTEIYERR
jgi:4-alpha-glucanotransferase